MTKRLPLLALTLLPALVGAAAQTDKAQAHHEHTHAPTQQAWTTQALLQKARGANRSLKLFKPQGLTATSLEVLPATEADEPPLIQQVPLHNGKGAVRARGKRQGGWYRISARSDEGNARVGTVVYFSNPGPAPRHMLVTSLPGLDISPAVLPREHRHYRAGETWPFQVRLDGKPLAGQQVLLETTGGHRASAVSDPQGRVQITFPEDFPPPEQREQAHGAHHGRAQQQFVLSTEHTTAQGIRQLAGFNFHYRPGAYDQKNLGMGGGCAMLGMLAATPLIRRRNPKEARK